MSLELLVFLVMLVFYHYLVTLYIIIPYLQPILSDNVSVLFWLTFAWCIFFHPLSHSMLLYFRCKLEYF